MKAFSATFTDHLGAESTFELSAPSRADAITLAAGVLVERADPQWPSSLCIFSGDEPLGVWDLTPGLTPSPMWTEAE